MDKKTYEDELIEDWEKLMETLKPKRHSLSISDKVYHRNCLGPDCTHKFKTKHRYLRLCEYCRKLEMYKSGITGR